MLLRSLATGWLLLGLVCGTLAAPVADWRPAHQSRDLTVHWREHRGSPLNELRGVTRVRTSLNALMALLKDAPSNQRWVYRSGGARILEEAGYDRAWVYGVVDAPWPMADRDTVVRFDFHQDSASGIITVDITNCPDYVARKPGLVRVPRMGGFWRLEPLADGIVEVTYQVYGDPGGLVPVWLANQAASLSVINTLKNLPTAVKAYQHACTNNVQEFTNGHQERC